MIEHGAYVNKFSKRGKTPLLYACEYGNYEMIKYLIEQGADINKESNIGDEITPLFKACKYGDYKMIKYLVEHGADINKENSLKQTPIWYACKIGNENIVKYLFECGANIYKEDKDGEIALIKALANGNNNLLDYFLKNENVIKFLKEYTFLLKVEEERELLYGKLIEIFMNLRLSFSCECPLYTDIDYLVKKYNMTKKLNKYI